MNLQPPMQTKVNNLSEKLVQCDYCQTFVPQVKAIEVAQRFYCSQEHAKL
ncbi:MAG: hypothetical protein JSR17_10700 [Proteobacteria bacterium]|nr:hypothetical protein [Pseudomonadota bacterium]